MCARARGPTKGEHPFLDFLSKEHAIVSPDRENTCTSVTHTLYDHGLRLPPNLKPFHKGGSDASFNTNTNKGRLSVII